MNALHQFVDSKNSALLAISGFGLLNLCYLSASFLALSFKHCCKRRTDLNEYKNSQGTTWAVVTGGSDGIGLGFAKQLAKNGFNICIMARNQAKIEEKLQGIKQEYPDIQTKCVVLDFGQTTEIAPYRLVVDTELKDLDIGILVLNAGVCPMGAVRAAAPATIQNALSVNVLHVVYLFQCLLPSLIARTPKTGVLVTGSGIRAIPAPGLCMYSATKNFTSYFCRAVGYDLYKVGANIDVLCYEPGGVDTKMTAGMGGPKPELTPEQAADVGLRDLGTSSRYQSQGNFKGEFMQDWLFGLAPISFVQRKMFEAIGKMDLKDPE